MDPSTDPVALESALASGVPADLLVPCDVAGMGSGSASLRQEAAILELAGAALTRIEVSNWRGRAADGFTEVLAPEPARWRVAAESFVAGADALDAYLAAVPPARWVASEARELWQQYLTTAAAAVAAAAVGSAPAVNPALEMGARVVQQQQALAAGGEAAALAMDAESLRRRAMATLADARRAVLTAGDVAVAALARAAEAAPEARRFWESTIRPADGVAVGHTTLDTLGMVPALGIVPDSVNAGWYALKGDGVNAAISAAGMVPLVGDAALAGRIARNLAIRPARLTRGLANPIPEVLFIAGGRTGHNLTPRLRDVPGLSAFDSLGVPIFRPGARIQPVLTHRLKDLRVWGPDGPGGHYSIGPTSEDELLAWMAAREGEGPHRLTAEILESLDPPFSIPKPGRSTR